MYVQFLGPLTVAVPVFYELAYLFYVSVVRQAERGLHHYPVATVGGQNLYLTKGDSM